MMRRWGIPHTGAMSAGDQLRALTVGGAQRAYLLHLPPQYTQLAPGQRLPLLLALHGRLGTGPSTARLTHLSAVADQHGFAVVYPDGVRRSWADGRGVTPADRAGVDDVAFLAALLDTLTQQYAFDSHHVCVTGISNGGFMAFRLAYALSHKVAAIAVVAANLPAPFVAYPAPARPVPLVLMCGTADPLVPYAGGPLPSDRGVVLSAPETAVRWAALCGCAAPPAQGEMPDVAHDGTRVVYASYTGGVGGAQVLFYTVVNGGHTWPGGMQYAPARAVGLTTRNLDASEALWQFCAQFRL